LVSAPPISQSDCNRALCIRLADNVIVKLLHGVERRQSSAEIFKDTGEVHRCSHIDGLGGVRPQGPNWTSWTQPEKAAR